MKARSLLFAVLLIAVLVVAGCGGGAATTGGAAAGKPLRVAVIMPSATTDMAFSQSMFSALKAIQAEMGGEKAMEIKYSENMFKVPDAAAALRDYASQGFDIVIATARSTAHRSRRSPRTSRRPPSRGAPRSTPLTCPTSYAYTAAAEEGGYVNGVLAALLSKSKQIGVTGPVDAGDAKTYVDGFTQGVAATDPAAKLSKTWTGSFSDVALMTEAAKTHIASGADVLTGSSQSVVGSIGAAKEKGDVLWFGTQQDQAALAPALVVASQQYDWTGILKEIIANRKNGKLGGEKFVLGLKNGGLKMVYNPEYKLPAEVKAAGDKAIEDIKAGTIKVNP